MPHAHGMTPPVPRIEIADDRDPCRIGRPDREANTLHTVDAGDLCAETGRELEMPALADQMKVKLAQQKPERIRILGILNRLPPCDAQKIGSTVLHDTFEQALGLIFFQQADLCA